MSYRFCVSRNITGYYIIYSFRHLKMYKIFFARGLCENRQGAESGPWAVARPPPDRAVSHGVYAPSGRQLVERWGPGAMACVPFIDESRVSGVQTRDCFT